MKIERTKNAYRNILFGGILKVYQILLPFVMRTAMIRFMGMRYLGLSGLFTSILQVLNLAELGVGSAMVFSMYRPIAEDDSDTICALMKLYRTYYRLIGLAIGAVGLLLTPVIPHLIRGEVPSELNLYILYFLNLGTTVISYWLFAYRNSLLTAHQRDDVLSKVKLLTSTVQYGSQLFVLAVFHDYYLYLIAALLTQIFTNVLTAAASKRHYPSYCPKGELDQNIRSDINKRIRDLFTSKVGSIVINSADTIVISAFLGLEVLAVYQNYYYVITSMTGLVTIVFTACLAGIGNSLIVETKEKNYRDLRKFTFIIAWIAGFGASGFLLLAQPFVRIFFGSESLMEMPAVVFLAAYYYIFEINALLNTYKDAGGIWHKDRWRPMVTAFANLGMNLIMVQFLSIYGIILSTVLSMLCVGMPWILRNLFSTMFTGDKLKGYVKLLLQSTACAAAAAGMSYLCAYRITGNPWKVLILRLLIVLIVPNAVFFLPFRKTEEMKGAEELIGRAVSAVTGKMHGRGGMR